MPSISRGRWFLRVRQMTMKRRSCCVRIVDVWFDDMHHHDRLHSVSADLLFFPPSHRFSLVCSATLPWPCPRKGCPQSAAVDDEVLRVRLPAGRHDQGSRRRPSGRLPHRWVGDNPVSMLVRLCRTITFTGSRTTPSFPGDFLARGLLYAWRLRFLRLLTERPLPGLRIHVDFG